MSSAVSFWIPGFPLKPLQGRTGCRLRTHESYGSITPEEGGWRWEPGLAGIGDPHTLRLVTSGMELLFPAGESFLALTLEPNLVAGWLPANARPELFSTATAPEVNGSLSSLSTPQGSVFLWMDDSTGPVKRFALLVNPEKTPDPVALSDSIPDLPSLRTLWESELEKRSDWLRHAPVSETSTIPLSCLEILLDLVEPPFGPFEGPWIRDDSLPEPGMRFSHLCTILPGLAPYRPDLAAAVLKTLSSLPRTDSATWAEITFTSGTSSPSIPAPPILAQTLVACGLPSPHLPLPPNLLQGIRSQIERYLVEESLPAWPEVSLSLAPETASPTLQGYEVSVHVISEIDALQHIAGDPSLLAMERATLEERLETAHWDSSRHQYVELLEEGAPSKRAMVSTLTPLLCTATPSAHKSELESQLDGFRLPERGLQEWQPLPGDPMPPPCRASTQIRFLGLLDTLPHVKSASLLAAWKTRIERLSPPLPPDEAVLALHLPLHEQEMNIQLDRYPPWIRFLERHRHALVIAAALLLLMFPTLLTLSLAFRTDLNIAEERLVAGTAETQVTLDQFREAEATYTRLLEQARAHSRFPTYYYRRGNIRFRQGRYAEALEDYQSAIEEDPEGNLYQARWNLAQAFARLDRTKDARVAFQEFIEEYGDELPSIRERARVALALLDS